MAERDYQHSRILDVHRWSDYDEVNKFVDKVYDEYLNNPSNENQTIKKRHLKVVLLDLYVAWLNDPELNIAVHMTTSAYSNGTVFNNGKSRYNELNIKDSTTKIIHRLRDAGLVGFKKGFKGSSEWRGYISRIWPLETLVQMFENAAFGEFDVGYKEGRETIILRDVDKKDIEYEDEHHICQMRMLVEKYNSLLEKTFIDIPYLDRPRIELPDKTNSRRTNKHVFVNITHHDKFVRRIFNNSSFSDGGRFYGGWWQRIDSCHRKNIRIDDNPTNEIDFSSLHVVLAYAKEGIDYWDTTNKDPYNLTVRGIKNPEHAREVTKTLFLLALNASTERSLFKAFRSELDYKSYPYTFPDEVLTELLDTIKSNHPNIAHLICSGAGLRLMNIDSRICEYVIADFVQTDTPILTVHDSFIVPFGEDDRLHQLMKEAFEAITQKRKINVKYNENLTKQQWYVLGAQDRDFYLDMFSNFIKTNPSNGYAARLKRHRQYYSTKC